MGEVGVPRWSGGEVKWEWVKWEWVKWDDEIGRRWESEMSEVGGV